MVVALIHGPMAANITANGKRTKNMAEDTRCGQTVPHLKGNGKMPSSTEGEDTRGPVEVLTKECGLITRGTDGVAILGLRRILTSVNG